MRSFAFHSRVERLCNALHKPSLFHLFQCLFQDIALAEHAEPLILLRKVESCSSVPVFLSKGGKALQNFVRKSLQRDVFKKIFFHFAGRILIQNLEHWNKRLFFS